MLDLNGQKQREKFFRDKTEICSIQWHSCIPKKYLNPSTSECTANWIQRHGPQPKAWDLSTKSLQPLPNPIQRWLVCCALCPEYETTQCKDQPNRQSQHCIGGIPANKTCTWAFHIDTKYDSNCSALTPNQFNSSLLVAESEKNVANANILQSWVKI